MPYKEEFSQDLDLLEAFNIFHTYQQGQVRDEDILSALSLLEYRYGQVIAKHCHIMRETLKIDDEEARVGLFHEALQNIMTYLKRNHPSDIKNNLR